MAADIITKFKIVTPHILNCTQASSDMKYMKYKFTKPTKIRKKPAKFVTFDLADEETEEEIEESIISAINVHEPRARTLNVRASSNPDRNEVDVKITFQVINTQEEVSLSIVLARLR